MCHEVEIEEERSASTGVAELVGKTALRLENVIEASSFFSRERKQESDDDQKLFAEHVFSKLMNMIIKKQGYNGSVNHLIPGRL